MPTNNPHNVNPDELAKFAALSSNWWNPEGEMKPLHQMNPLRLDYVKKHATLHNQRVLDVGCGGGLLSEAMAKLDAQVTGIDLSDALIEVARSHAEQQKLSIDYHCISAESLAQTKSNSFDVITCMELLEHVPDPLQLIKNCAELLTPQGIVFFSTINRNLKAYLLAIVGAEYITRLLPKGTHDYAQFIRPSELASWARTCGLHLVDLTGIHYHPFQQRFTLGHNVSVNYIACFRRESHHE